MKQILNFQCFKFLKITGAAVQNDLLRQECFWILCLQTIIPKGLNVVNDFSCFL